jgi:hypothetical protein
LIKKGKESNGPVIATSKPKSVKGRLTIITIILVIWLPEKDTIKLIKLKKKVLPSTHNSQQGANSTS